jgi:dihydropteroate synthase
MGILNVTPDSFSDGGRFLHSDLAIERGIRMSTEGADIIDVGGESTRPGSDPVPEDEEMSRVIPVIRALSKEIEGTISVDTTKASVAEAALEAGAAIVNDVSAMRLDPRMKRLAAESGAGVVLMHMLGTPKTMQAEPQYEDVVIQVRDELLTWAFDAETAGVARDGIAIDPGIGFGKTLQHNMALLKHLDALSEEFPEKSRGRRYPVLVGPSRKSFIGKTLDVEVDERLEGTAAVIAWSVTKGVNIVRVHDVKEMVRVVEMTEAILKS